MIPEQGQARIRIGRQLRELEKKGLFRHRKSIDSGQSTRVVLDGKTVLNFCSDDYLGLASDPALVRALQQAASEYGVGSGASPMVCGRSTAHASLEEELASITGRDRALVFSSGYLANLAIVTTFAGTRSDRVFQDKLNHASMLDAAILSRARLTRYPHGDLEALERALDSSASHSRLVLTDTIFSMDGDLVPLGGLAAMCAAKEVCLVVDDAHGFGVFGASGGGVLQHLGLGQAEVPLMMATLGKAVGCAGAFVAGDRDMIELLVQKARPYIYSTALAPALAVTATKALQLIQTDSSRRRHLFELIECFRTGAQQRGIKLQASFSPIQPFIIGSAEKAVAMSAALLRQGILIAAIRPPTVPANTSRLRITLSAGHTEADIEVLLDALADCGAVDARDGAHA